jgi:site-specific DNA recombinase
MEHYEIELYCVKEQLENSLIGRLTRMFLGFLAEWEREKILDRTATGRINKAKEGKVSASGYKLMYGFQWNDPEKKDFPIINPKQAAILRELAERYADGESCRSLIRDLIARGVPSPLQAHIAASGKPQEENTSTWNARGIINLLTDPRIVGKGVTIFHKHNSRAKNPLEPVAIPDGTYPAIISEKLYQRILARAKINREEASRGKNPEAYLLRAGFIKCHCGRAMIGVTRYDKSDKTHKKDYIHYTYDCANPWKCGCRVNSKKTDVMVWKDVERLADHIDLIERAIKLATSNQDLSRDAQSIDLRAYPNN